MSYLPQVAAAVMAASAAQLLLKSGMLLLMASPSGWQQDWLLLITDASLLGATAVVIAGLLVYALAAVLWLRVLQFTDLSIAYPAMSISYVIVYLGAVALPQIDETFSSLRVFGIILIVVGVSLTSLPSRDPS